MNIPLPEVEAALAAGELWARIGPVHWWLARRNGKTRLWKRDPEKFLVPVKAGLKATGQLTNLDRVQRHGDFNWQHAMYVISNSKPLGA